MMFRAGRVVLLFSWTLVWTTGMVGHGFLLLRVPVRRVSHNGLRNKNKEHQERRSSSLFASIADPGLHHHPDSNNHTDHSNELPLSTRNGGKATAVSFLPEETLQRVQNSQRSNPVEKVKLAKDPTQAFVDIYDYARKIRQGALTWDQVEAADLDTVRGLDS